MNERRQPPGLAIWLLRNFCAEENREALTGDLLERLGEGQSAGWFWHQVLIAIMVGSANRLRSHWPQIGFSISGTALLWFWSGKTMRYPAIEHLWAWGVGLQWPMSSAYDFAFRAALEALMVQPLLAALLFLGRAFSWRSMLRTLLISCALCFASETLLWVTFTPTPTRRFYLTWAAVRGGALLISAWAGCRMPVRPVLRRAAIGPETSPREERY